MGDIDQQIRERVPGYFPDLASNGSSIDIRMSRRGGGHDSEVYEVAVTAGHSAGRRLILKLHRPAVKPEEMIEQARKNAQAEFQALAFLWRELSRRSDQFTVPRPLDYLPDSAALVVEKCQGERLDRVLRWARLLKTNSQLERLCRQVKACGEWLALFHQVTGRPGDPSEIYERIERDFSDDLKTCINLGLDSGLAAQLASRFEKLKNMAFSGDHQVVGYHCDLGPYNVLVSPEKITVIDFEGLQPGIIYDDLCYFLGMIEGMPFYHLGRELSQRIRESFLEGYSVHGVEKPLSPSREQFDVFMTTTMVKIMAHSPMQEAQAGWFNRWKRQQRLEFYANWFKAQVD